MVGHVVSYISSFGESFGERWNRFWYSSQDDIALAVLRTLVGIAAVAWLATFTFDLDAMFGADGWVSPLVVHQATTDGNLQEPSPGFSYLFWIQSKPLLYATHAIAIGTGIAMVGGLRPRVTTILTWLIVLSYIHRGPVLIGRFEIVLSMLLMYISIRPGRTWKHVKQSADSSYWNNLAVRLIQVHICGLYVLIVASKLATPDWWNGTAAWYLATDAQHRLLDLSWVTGSTYFTDTITHVWVAFEVLYPILIWRAGLRPLIIAVSILFWVFTALATGQIGYAYLMIVVNLAFVTPESIRCRIRRSA